jgi:hypothetical protein
VTTEAEQEPGQDVDQELEYPARAWIDLGGGFRYCVHDPRTDFKEDRDPDASDVFVAHTHSNGHLCGGYLMQHTMITLSPLTVSPSLVFPCEAHGWVENGAWRQA